MYANGQGISKAYKNAVKWFRLAAEQGTARAQFNLGVMYEKGLGVKQDYLFAHMWSNIAASNGNKNAFQNIDKIAKLLTSTELSAARNLAHECIPRNTKGVE